MIYAEISGECKFLLFNFLNLNFKTFFKKRIVFLGLCLRIDS